MRGRGSYGCFRAFTPPPTNRRLSGSGFVISNLRIDRSIDYVGLFRFTSDSTIKNVGLENVDLKGKFYVGGLAGMSCSDSTISNCYSTGSVIGKGTTGGLSGYSDYSSSIINSFWDINKSGQSYGIGVNQQRYPSDVTGLATAEMSNKDNFINAGWSETDWAFYDGYAPRLLWEGPPPPPAPLRLQIGAYGNSTSTLTVDTAFYLGDFSVDFTDTESARTSIDSVDELLDKINTKNAELGAVMNRLNSVLDSQTTQIENLTASRSTILDADIAQESANFTKAQILQQTSATLLAQSKNLQASIITGLLS